MVKIEHSGYLKNGKLYFNNYRRFEQEVKPLPDCDVDIIIKKKGKASSESRKYYFGVVVKEITGRLIELGNEVDEVVVHEFLKLQCNKTYLRDEEGTIIGEVGGSTTDHNPEERAEYIERCIRFAAEKLDISISPPNTQEQLFKVA